MKTFLVTTVILQKITHYIKLKPLPLLTTLKVVYEISNTCINDSTYRIYVIDKMHFSKFGFV